VGLGRGWVCTSKGIDREANPLLDREANPLLDLTSKALLGLQMLPGVVVRVVSSDVGCVLGVCWVYRMASVVSAVAQARKFTYKTGLACAVAYGGGENMRDQLRCVSPPSRARALSLSLSLSLSVGLYRCGDERRVLACTATHSRIYICIYMYIYI